MLVQFFTVIFANSQNIKDFTSQLSDDIPISVCMNFSNVSSKHAFCVDASIDVQQICTTNGFLFEHAHNLEVPIEEYTQNYSILVNFGEPLNYYLYEIKKPEIPPVDLLV